MKNWYRPIIALVLGVFVTLGMGIRDSHAAEACVSWSSVMKEWQKEGIKVHVLSAQDAAKVVQDFDDEAGVDLQADHVYVLHVKGADGSEATGVAFVDKNCFLGAAKVRPEHLTQLLGRSA